MTRIKQAGPPIVVVALIAGILGYILGCSQSEGENQSVVSAAQAEETEPAGLTLNSSKTVAWSPTKASPKHDVYYPGTEDLKPDEMRVICTGSGMPMPRLKQAAASFVVELGNGDKFIFDMGTGSMHRIYALGIPLDYIDKVFLTHLHCDHFGDLPGFYMYGPQNNRSVPLRVWGPGGGGTRPEWGTKAAMHLMQEMFACMNGTLAGLIDFRSLNLDVT
jgi:ribonuclease Z